MSAFSASALSLPESGLSTFSTSTLLVPVFGLSTFSIFALPVPESSLFASFAFALPVFILGLLISSMSCLLISGSSTAMLLYDYVNTFCLLY